MMTMRQQSHEDFFFIEKEFQKRKPRRTRAANAFRRVRVVRGVFVQQLPAKKTKRDDKRK